MSATTQADRRLDRFIWDDGDFTITPPPGARDVQGADGTGGIQHFGWVMIHGHPVLIGDGGGGGGGHASAHPGGGGAAAPHQQLNAADAAAYKTAYNAYNSAVSTHKSAVGTPGEARALARVHDTAASLHGLQQGHSASNVAVPHMTPAMQQRLSDHVAAHQATNPAHPIHQASPHAPGGTAPPPVGARTVAAPAPVPVAHAPAPPAPAPVAAAIFSVAGMSDATKANFIARSRIAPVDAQHANALAMHTQAYNAYTSAHAMNESGSTPARAAKLQQTAQALQDHRAAMAQAGHAIPTVSQPTLQRIAGHAGTPASATAHVPAPPAHATPPPVHQAVAAPAPPSAASHVASVVSGGTVSHADMQRAAQAIVQRVAGNSALDTFGKELRPRSQANDTVVHRALEGHLSTAIKRQEALAAQHGADSLHAAAAGATVSNLAQALGRHREAIAQTNLPPAYREPTVTGRAVTVHMATPNPKYAGDMPRTAREAFIKDAIQAHTDSRALEEAGKTLNASAGKNAADELGALSVHERIATDLGHTSAAQHAATIAAHPALASHAAPPSAPAPVSAAQHVAPTPPVHQAVAAPAPPSVASHVAPVVSGGTVSHADMQRAAQAIEQRVPANAALNGFGQALRLSGTANDTATHRALEGHLSTAIKRQEALAAQHGADSLHAAAAGATVSNLAQALGRHREAMRQAGMNAPAYREPTVTGRAVTAHMAIPNPRYSADAHRVAREAFIKDAVKAHTDSRALEEAGKTLNASAGKNAADELGALSVHERIATDLGHTSAAQHAATIAAHPALASHAAPPSAPPASAAQHVPAPPAHATPPPVHQAVAAPAPPSAAQHVAPVPAPAATAARRAMDATEQAQYTQRYNAYNSAVSTHKSAIGTPREAQALARVHDTARALQDLRDQHDQGGVGYPAMNANTGARLAGHVADHAAARAGSAPPSAATHVPAPASLAMATPPAPASPVATKADIDRAYKEGVIDQEWMHKGELAGIHTALYPTAQDDIAQHRSLVLSLQRTAQRDRDYIRSRGLQSLHGMVASHAAEHTADALANLRASYDIHGAGRADAALGPLDAATQAHLGTYAGNQARAYAHLSPDAARTAHISSALDMDTQHARLQLADALAKSSDPAAQIAGLQTRSFVAAHTAHPDSANYRRAVTDHAAHPDNPANAIGAATTPAAPIANAIARQAPASIAAAPASAPPAASSARAAANPAVTPGAPIANAIAAQAPSGSLTSRVPAGQPNAPLRSWKDVQTTADVAKAEKFDILIARKMEQAAKPWAQSLSRPEHDAIQDYRGLNPSTKKAYDIINGALRNVPVNLRNKVTGMWQPVIPRLNAEYKDRIRALDSAFEKPGAALDRDVTVYRGIHARPWSGNAVADLTKMPVGHVLEDSAFVSTSVNREYAANAFAQTQHGHAGAVLEIHVPKGTKAIVMDATQRPPRGSDRATEEVLFPRGTKMRVTGHFHSPDKYGNMVHTISVEMIPPDSPPKLPFADSWLATIALAEGTKQMQHHAATDVDAEHDIPDDAEGEPHAAVYVDDLTITDAAGNPIKSPGQPYAPGALMLTEGAHEEYAKGNLAALLEYWHKNFGGGHGEPGDYNACVATLTGKKGIDDAHSLCAWLHHKATGAWPGHASGEK